MKKDSVLFTVTDLGIIPELKNKGIKRFVFPLSFFCVGIPNTFAIEDIKEDNAYLLVNRILDCDSIDKLDRILHNLPSNIKGIIFDDVGVIEITNDLKLERILYLTHFNTNYESVNYFFDYVDEVIVSTDITKEEIIEISKHAKKKISLFVFGLVPSLYSRRSLLTNYALHNNIEKENCKDLNIGNEKFIAIENDYGMVMYHYPYYNGLELLSIPHKYCLYMPILLENKQIIELIDNDLKSIPNDNGFLNKKTIYKIKDISKEDKR